MVPVLPATAPGTPSVRAEAPVPELITPSRSEVTRNASGAPITGRVSRFALQIARPESSVTASTTPPPGAIPPFASGRYARARSSGVVSNTPRASAGTGLRSPSTPRLRAVPTTVFSPTAWASRTVAVLSEPSSARRTVTCP